MTHDNDASQGNMILRLLWQLRSNGHALTVLILTVGGVILMTHFGLPSFDDNWLRPLTSWAALLLGLHVALVGGIALFAHMRGRHKAKAQIQDEFAHLETRGDVFRWARLYDRLVGLITLGKEQDWRRRTLTTVAIKPGEKVLDVGCGTGGLAIAASEMVGATGEVIGTDASPQMIDVARQKAKQKGANVMFQAELIERLPFQADRFDVVLSTFMMHHLPDDLKAEGLAEIYRVLNPNGRLLIVDIESSSEGNPLQRTFDLLVQLHGGHQGMRNNVKRLAPMLEKAGFNYVETEAVNRQVSSIMGYKGAA